MTAETDWGGVPSVLRMILGRQLEELRTRAGLSYAEAGAAIGVSHSTIRRMEAAKVARLRLTDAEKLLQVYGVTDQREIDTFLQSVREANKRGWWHTYRDVMPDWFAAYLSLEQAALHIRAYENQFVHELLQTEDYARAVLKSGAIGQTSPDDIERHVALRMQRQELLARPDAPRFWVVMDETALRRPVGGPEVMRAQIDKLLEATKLPHVTLQVAPFANGPHPGTYGPFVLFRFAMSELPDMVYSEYLTGAVYLDARTEVATHLEVMDRMAAQAATAQRTKEILEDLRKEL